MHVFSRKHTHTHTLVCDLEKSCIIILSSLEIVRAHTRAQVIQIFLDFSPFEKNWKYGGAFSFCCQQGVCITAGVDWISEWDVRLVEATPSSVVDGCLDGWDEGGMRWKKYTFASLETLLHRKTWGCSGLNVCVLECVCVSQCIYIYTLLCKSERGRGQRSQTLTERGTVGCTCVCELAADLLPPAEVLEWWAKMNLSFFFLVIFSWKVEFEPGLRVVAYQPSAFSCVSVKLCCWEFDVGTRQVHKHQVFEEEEHYVNKWSPRIPEFKLNRQKRRNLKPAPGSFFSHDL